MVKKLLARGILLSARMNVGGATQNCSGCNEGFYVYKSGIAEGDCSNPTSNHQITMAGYGHYKG